MSDAPAELSPEAKALIGAALEEDAPPPGAKARLKAAVDTAVRAAAPGSGWTPKVLGGVALVAAGGGLLFALWPRSSAAPPRAVLAPVVAPGPAPGVAAPTLPPPPVLVLPGRKPVVAVQAPKADEPPSTPLGREQGSIAHAAQVTNGDSSLEEELRLMSSAQEALRSKQPERAMALLAEHAARFPDGELRQERAAVHILALCALGREDEARQEAQRFYTEAPQSPLMGRVRDSCAGEESP